jgi:DNA-binding MarR family transcriptional regulator
VGAGLDDGAGFDGFAETDFQRFFQVTPPAVHQMIVELERRGLISRVSGQPPPSR